MLQHRGGEFENNLNNILRNANDLDTAISVTSNSPYIDSSDAKHHMIKFKNMFTVLTLNVQSIRAKFESLVEFLNELSEQNFYFSAICIQESWLQTQDDMALFSIPNYNCIPLSATVSKHGGLLIYLHSSFQFKTLDLNKNCNQWESLFLEITNEHLTKKLILGNIYRQPKDGNEDIKSFLDEYSDTLTKITDKKVDIIIAGDFNIDLLKVTSREKFADYLDSMLSFSLYPVITLPTRFSKHKATLIDHIFCRTQNQQRRLEGGIILKKISDHYPAFMAYKNQSYNNTPPKFITIQKSSPEAIDNFTHDIETQDYSLIINDDLQTDPTSNIEVLNSILVQARNKHLPTKTVRFRRHKHKINQWMTSGILISIKFRDELYKRFHQLDPDSEQYSTIATNLKTYNRILKHTMRQAKNTYYHKLLDNYKNDAKKTWETLKCVMNLSKTKSDLPNFFIINNSKITNREAIANHFNEYFAGVGPLLASKLKNVNNHCHEKYLCNPTEAQFKFQNINQSYIIQIIKELKPKSSTDHIGFSAKLLKTSASVLSYPLSIIVNQSLNTGIFPQPLKISKVTPLFKKDDKTSCNNYRPISLLPIISKVLEKVVQKQLSAYLSENKNIFCSQHGFRQNHSTETATLEFVDKILQHLENNETPISIFLDLTKAFDTLNHDILLYKLSFYGINNTALNWFSSYLSNRYQFVEFKNCHSSKLKIQTGVPQGSVLGPLLFSIYINDINIASTAFDFILYADDTTLTCIPGKLLQSENQDVSISDAVNDELGKIFEWLLANKLSLNVSKSKYMVFHSPQKAISTLKSLKPTINGIPLSKTTEFNFLGTIITETLSWKAHSNYVGNKLARTIGIMKRLKHTLPRSSLLLLYNSLFASVINYSTLVWGLTSAERLIKLQKKAVRIICGEKYNAHTEPLFKMLRILKFDDIVKLMSLQFYFKYSNNLLPHHFENIFSFDSVNHGYDTRGKNISRPQIPKKSFTSRCIRYHIPSLLKIIPSQILDKVHTHSFGGFSNFTKNYFLSDYNNKCLITNCYICNN